MSSLEEKFWNNPKIVKEFVDYPKDQYWEKVLKKYKKGKKRLLDLGCGGGRNSELAARSGYDVYGCDYSEGMVDITRLRMGSKYGPEVKDRFIKASMLKLPYEDNSFDVVIANGVYHNAYTLQDFKRALKETKRVLKPDGLLLLNVFNSDNVDAKTVRPAKSENVYLTKEGLRMVLLKSEEILKLFEGMRMKAIVPSQLYIRSLSTGKRSILKTVLKKGRNKTDSVFPEKGMNKVEINSVLEQRFLEIPSWGKDSKVYRLGFAMTKPHSIALSVYLKFAKLNNNNTGLHTQIDEGKLSGTRELERQIISWMSNLLSPCELDGYISSGGTEGNIAGLWIGRNFLRRHNHKKICVISSKLSHVSVSKASNILDVPIFGAKLDANFGIDVNELKELVSNLYLERGYNGFIILLTAGYYSTGTSDQVDKILKILSLVKRSFTKIKFYIHVDAAFGGFVYPFSNPGFKFDFRNEMVQSMTLDPHKMGLMPYSCGIFLCRKGLTKYVKTANLHAGVIDQTLIGSRPGATAAALWALLAKLGKYGYQKIVVKCLNNKRYFIKQILKVDLHARIVGDSTLNNFAVHFSLNRGKIGKDLEQKYRLVSNNGYYHFYVMPHITKDIIDSFVKSLKFQS